VTDSGELDLGVPESATLEPAAGFLHHLRGRPSGAGFAAGGELDTLAPGPSLCEAVAAAAAHGHDQLGESELIGVLCAWRRISSWAAAGEAATVLALDRGRAAKSQDTGKNDLAEHVGDELAAALTLTGRSADRLLSLWRGLGRLDDVHAALERGEIDWAKACVFVDELGVLASDQAARAIAGRLLGRDGAGGWTTGQLRARLRQAVLAADPDAAVRRRKARAEADVESWDELADRPGESLLPGLTSGHREPGCSARRHPVLRQIHVACDLGHRRTRDPQLRTRLRKAAVCSSAGGTPAALRSLSARLSAYQAFITITNNDASAQAVEVTMNAED